jgi:sec-independent protein translocase protein TatA
MTSLALFGNLGAGEIAIILLVILLLFGASKIPELMRSMGSGIGEFKKGLKDSIKEEMPGQEPAKPEPAKDEKK